MGKIWSGLGVRDNGCTLADSSWGFGTGKSGVKSLSVDAGKSNDSNAGDSEHEADLRQSGASIETVV